MDIDYGLLAITIRNGPRRVSIIPPPPSEAERWVGLGLAIARWGYTVRILNLPTCRESTLEKALAGVEGVPIYLRYSHALAYVGRGALLEPEEPTPDGFRREAEANSRYLLDWRRCLELRRRTGDVDVLGALPDALEGLRIWLAERLG
ncbi:MAG: hypothetical protein AT711_06200 [Thermoproteus sp. CIS_19]|nr:MAG: hypothetical protein AT711_06200 [Thermoproteus sp. CIS_19]